MESNMSNRMSLKTSRPWQKMTGVMLLALLVSLAVLLGPLGVKALAAVKSEFSVSEHSSDKLKPSVNGKFVVWEDDRDGKSNIYAKNLSTGAEFVVSSGVEVKRKPVTNGAFVVWEDERSGDSDVYAKNLTSGEEFVVAGGAGDQRKPSISSSTVVYESKNGSGKWEIYTYDLSSRNNSIISTGGDNTLSLNPTISGDTVVWQAPVTKQKADGTTVIVSKIFAKNLTTGQEYQVNPDGLESQDQPAVSDGIVVWRQESVANYDIFGKDLYAKDLETGKVFQITTNEKDQVAPAISGAVVVWEDHSNGKAEVHGKNLKTGETFQVVASSNPQTNPAISGETVVWESQRLSPSTTDPTQPDPNYGRYDIEGAEVEAPPATPTGLKTADSSSYITLRWSRNTEVDLAGYNVYRSDSPTGTFVKLNGSLLTSPFLADQNAPKGAISYYRVTAVDTPGNESLPVRGNAAAIATSSISLSASPAVLDYGAATTLSGKLSAEGKTLSGKQVTLEQKPAGASDFSAVSKLTTDADGTFRMGGLKPKKNTSYRVSYAGEKAIRNSTAGQGVRVRAKVSLSKPRVDRNVNITGRVNTTRNGKVNVVVRRNGKIISSTTVRLSDYRYRKTYRLDRAGRYNVQVIVPKTRAHLGDTIARSFSKR